MRATVTVTVIAFIIFSGEKQNKTSHWVITRLGII